MNNVVKKLFVVGFIGVVLIAALVSVFVRVDGRNLRSMTLEQISLKNHIQNQRAEIGSLRGQIAGLEDEVHWWRRRVVGNYVY